MSQLDHYLKNFAGCRILVVGDLMLDEYLWGHVERISPEAPVPVLNLVKQAAALGGAGNVVRNLCSLGALVTVAGVIGQDGAGDRILALLEALGAETSGVLRDPGRKSTRKTRLISLEHGQQVFRIDEESTEEVRGETEDRLTTLLRTMPPGAQAVLCSDYQKGLLTPPVLAAVFRAARRQKLPCIVGPKNSQVQKYRGASVLMPNLRELAQLAGKRGQGDAWMGEAARRLIEKLGLDALVVTRGGEGMRLFEPGKGGLRQVEIPTVARSVYDVTGAGDTAIAAFSLAVAAGAGWEAAAQLANLAAGVVVGKRGTESVTPPEMQAQLGARRGGPSTRKRRR
ncbi:MAG TPA: D-glycero-beta-D-manno-heptose-7-phosphate kinase [Candidatus Acidoferrales bacterium]|nr:D-glycero-beta-D-manno-heptose-7-phosphate kinase [Candidatus Acidoferrales bacterium]